MDSSLGFFLSGLNWVDLIVLLLIAVYAVEGFSLGILRSFVDFLSFVASFISGLIFYSFISEVLSDNFGIPHGFSNAIGFFSVAILTELLLSKFLIKLALSLPSYSNLNSKIKKNRLANNLLGVIPGILSALVLLTFILTTVTTLPTAPILKQAILNSKSGSLLLSQSLGFEDVVNKVFGQAVSDALTFMTVEPRSEESLKLNIRAQNLTVDFAAEKEMFGLVNFEREKLGLNKLTFDERLAETGRKHCKDMFERGYFSHYTPEGLSPFDRMASSDITYSYAGENLALAPSTQLSHEGLMRSPGHRENILSENFGRVGIGVIDGGTYGKMFCQEFTD